MTIGLEHYLILAAVLFSIGMYGALAKRNAIIILMSIELMLNAVNVMLVAFSRFVASPELLTGHVFTIFIMVVAAAEAAVGLAVIMSIYRNRETIDVTKINLMKW